MDTTATAEPAQHLTLSRICLAAMVNRHVDPVLMQTAEVNLSGYFADGNPRHLRSTLISLSTIDARGTPALRQVSIRAGQLATGGDFDEPDLRRLRALSAAALDLSESLNPAQTVSRQRRNLDVQHWPGFQAFVDQAMKDLEMRHRRRAAGRMILESWAGMQPDRKKLLRHLDGLYTALYRDVGVVGALPSDSPAKTALPPPLVDSLASYGPLPELLASKASSIPPVDKAMAYLEHQAKTHPDFLDWRNASDVTRPANGSAEIRECLMRALARADRVLAARPAESEMEPTSPTV